MDLNVTSVDVQRFSIGTLSYHGALACLYVFFVTWCMLVASAVSIAINYYRWQKPAARVPPGAYGGILDPLSTT